MYESARLRIADLTPRWLSRVMSHYADDSEYRVVDVRSERIAADNAYMGWLYRFHLEYEPSNNDGPATLVAKLPSRDPDFHGTWKEAHRAEANFYARIAPEVGARVPECYGIVREDSGLAIVLMEDIVGATAGNQVAGCDAQTAGQAIDALAALHAGHWGRAERVTELTGRGMYTGSPEGRQGWTEKGWEGFLRISGDRDAEYQVLEKLPTNIAKLLRDCSPASHTLLHLDIRLDNMMFYEGNLAKEPVIIDWSSAGCGPAADELAFFIAQNMTPEIRRECEWSLVQRYYDGLVDRGVTNYSWDALEIDYRRSLLGSMFMPIAWGGGDLENDLRTSKGDGPEVEAAAERLRIWLPLWEVQADRNFAAIIDNNALALLA